MLFSYLVVFPLTVFSVVSGQYYGYKVYEVVPKTLADAKLLTSFGDNEDFDFWTDVRSLNVPIQIMVSKMSQPIFEKTMSMENIEYSVIVNDVEAKIKEEKNIERSTSLTRGNVTFTEYMRHNEINAYLDRLAADYPNIIQTEIIGQSFEGRNLTLVRISSGGTQRKPTIFAEAAIHAREWIAPPVALYIINQLVENPNNSYLYQDIDWAIIPVVNPDGYEYTHTNERFWRKTRSPGTICHGVDGNRNFNASWGAFGSSRWQCDNTYAGFRVFSELETRAIRDYILRYKDDIKLYIDIHSFGRWLLYPWGYTAEDPDNLEDLLTLGRLFNDAIYSHSGGNYTVTSFLSGLYYASGTSVDWVKEIGIDLAYTLELPAGGTGFDPPPATIQPVVEETWEGFKAFHSYIQSNFVN